MARTSTPWRLLPAGELGCGSPATCWRRLTEWANAGVFDRLHLAVLDRLGEQGKLDWSRVSVDAMSMRAKRGGPRWRKSSRSWQAWNQAPPGLRRQRAAADGGGDRRQCQRHHHVPGGRGRHRAGPYASRAAADPPRPGPRRQRLGQPSQPGLPAPAWDPAADRPARGGVVGQAWAPPVEGGAVAVVVELLQAAGGTVGQRAGRWFAFVLVACAVVCFNRLQSARRGERPPWRPGWREAVSVGGGVGGPSGLRPLPAP